jgi:hypothetical protein
MLFENEIYLPENEADERKSEILKRNFDGVYSNFKLFAFNLLIDKFSKYHKTSSQSFFSFDEFFENTKEEQIRRLNKFIEQDGELQDKPIKIQRMFENWKNKKIELLSGNQEDLILDMKDPGNIPDENEVQTKYKEVMMGLDQGFDFVSEKLKSNFDEYLESLRRVSRQLIEDNFHDSIFDIIYNSELNKKLKFLDGDKNYDLKIIKDLNTVLEKDPEGVDFSIKLRIDLENVMKLDEKTTDIMI